MQQVYNYAKHLENSPDTSTCDSTVQTISDVIRTFFKTKIKTDQDQDFKILSRPRPRPNLVFKTKILHLKTKTFL